MCRSWWRLRTLVVRSASRTARSRTPRCPRACRPPGRAPARGSCRPASRESRPSAVPSSEPMSVPSDRRRGRPPSAWPGRSRAPSRARRVDAVESTPCRTMLAGFRSRWTMPFSCAASSASAIWRAMASASAIGSGPRSNGRASVWPSTSSSTSARDAIALPPTRRSRRCADDSAWRAGRASRAKRARRSGSAVKCDGRILIATSRPSLLSRARYTSPMPPAPSGGVNPAGSDLTFRSSESTLVPSAATTPPAARGTAPTPTHIRAATPLPVAALLPVSRVHSRSASIRRRTGADEPWGGPICAAAPPPCDSGFRLADARTSPSRQ